MTSLLSAKQRLQYSRMARSAHKIALAEIGNKYGEWTVIAVGKSVQKKIVLICQCACGAEKAIPAHRLRKSKTKSCATCSRKRLHKFVPSTAEIGKTYGLLTVIRVAERHERRLQGQGHFWLCRCKCGTERFIIQGALRSGGVKSCGCISRTIRRPVAIGQSFRSWTVIDTKVEGKRYHCICRCICGAVRPVSRFMLLSGSTKSCGHEYKARRGEQSEKHGQYKTAEYRTWKQIMARCHNPHHGSYRYYGARSIAVCEIWRKSFKAFVSYVGLKPTPGHTLDRLDNTKGYEPGNVKWSTMAEQHVNQGTINILAVKNWGFSHRINWIKLGLAIQDGKLFEEAVMLAKEK